MKTNCTKESDIGTPADGPMWSVFGVYEGSDEGDNAAIFLVHAQSAGEAEGKVEMEKGRVYDDPDQWLPDSFLVIGVYAGKLFDARDFPQDA